MINLEMCIRDAVVLRHTLFMHTKDHVGFFSDEHILKLRELSQLLDKEIQREHEDFRQRKLKDEDDKFNYDTSGK